MGKYLNTAARLGELSRIVSSAKPKRAKGTTLPKSPNRVATTSRTANPIGLKVQQPANKKKMEALEEEPQQCRTPLAKVVADCTKRWFQDTLKEATAGDIPMQVLVGQMYYSGYGVPKNSHKVTDYTVTSFVYRDLFGSVKPQEIEARFGKCAQNCLVTEQVIQIHVNWKAKIYLFLNLQNLLLYNVKPNMREVCLGVAAIGMISCLIVTRRTIDT